MTTTKPAAAPAANAAPADWDRLHARIAEARARSERLLRPNELDEDARLQERARRLSRPLSEGIAWSGDDLLAFTLPGERYGVPTRAVRHVFPTSAPVPIPWAPPLFRGLVNDRGRPLLVIDVGLLLGRPSRSDDADVPLVLVLADEPDDLGLAVSSVDHLGPVATEEIARDRLPEGLADVAFLRGVTADRLLVLDIDKLLHDPRLVLGPLA